jgi:hypothetical protein
MTQPHAAVPLFAVYDQEGDATFVVADSAPDNALHVDVSTLSAHLHHKVEVNVYDTPEMAQAVARGLSSLSGKWSRATSGRLPCGHGAVTIVTLGEEPSITLGDHRSNFSDAKGPALAASWRYTNDRMLELHEAEKSAAREAAERLIKKSLMETIRDLNCFPVIRELQGEIEYVPGATVSAGGYSVSDIMQNEFNMEDAASDISALPIEDWRRVQRDLCLAMMDCTALDYAQGSELARDHIDIEIVEKFDEVRGRENTRARR